jgi:hypothetical protein
MRSTRHLGGDSCQCLALEIGIVAILCDIALIFGSKAVITMTNGNLRGNPEGTSQAGIAKLGELRLASKLARLVGRKIKAAELEELAMVMETT